jgi:homogentisate 1,2-dioxygenase
MSEYMGMIYGKYDAKTSEQVTAGGVEKKGFVPGTLISSDIDNILTH